MNTEITKIKALAELSGWVFYDGHCPFCCRWAARLEQVLTRRGFDLAPLQTPWVSECLDLRIPENPSEMLVMTPDGQVFGGGEAVLYLARRIWWAKPLSVLGLTPVGHRLMKKAYRVLAEHRMCLGGACAVQFAKK